MTAEPSETPATKTKVLTVRITQDWYELLVSAAETNGHSISGEVRAALAACIPGLDGELPAYW